MFVRKILREGATSPRSGRRPSTASQAEEEEEDESALVERKDNASSNNESEKEHGGKMIKGNGKNTKLEISTVDAGYGDDDEDDVVQEEKDFKYSSPCGMDRNSLPPLSPRAMNTTVDDGYGDEDDDDDDDLEEEEEEETFLIKNLDTGEMERMTMHDLVNGGKSTTSDADSSPKVVKNEEEEEELETQAQGQEKDKNGKGISTSASPPVAAPAGNGAVEASVSKSQQQEEEEKGMEELKIESKVNSKEEPHVPITRMQRAAVFLLRSVITRRAKLMMSRRFSKLQAALAVENETEKYAEQISRKQAECENLMNENVSLRVEMEEEHEQAAEKREQDKKSAGGDDDDDVDANKAPKQTDASKTKLNLTKEDIMKVLQENGVNPEDALNCLKQLHGDTNKEEEEGGGKSKGTKVVSLKDDPDYGPYFKMLAVKVPRQAIENKMMLKGLDPKMLDKDPNSPSPNQPKSADENEKSDSTGEEKKSDVIALKDDPEYGPFIKMLAVKVPRPAVENKMRLKGLDPAMLDKDPNSPSPNQPGAKKQGEGAGKKDSDSKGNTTSLKDDPDYGPFFKMLAVKVPKQAVINKMTAKGLDPSMLDKDPNSPAPAKEQEKKDGASSNMIKLKDDPRYAPFFKMLAVKVPRGAVEAKMRSKGLDPSMLDKDPESMIEKESKGDDSAAAAAAPAPAGPVVKLKDDPDYGPFFKMLAVRVPRGAVEAKMKAKGLDPSYLDKGPDAPAPPKAKKEMIKLKDDPRYAPFFKMLAVKVPRGAVEAKMRSKGLDPSMLDKDPESMIEKESKGDDSAAAPAPAGPVVKLKDDPDYGPFFKMLAVRVPRGAVEAKMKAKGLDPSYLDKGPDAPAPPKGGAKGKGGLKIPSKPKVPEKKPDRIVRRKLHWRKIPKNKLESAEKVVWDSCKRFVFEQREIKELSQFFTVNMTEQERQKAKEKAEKAKAEGKANGATKKKEKVEKKQILETQRTNNISIVLSRMKGKGVNSKVIRRCLFTLEIPDEVNLEDVRSVLMLVPTPEEEKLLKAYTGDRKLVGKAEKYFLDLMDIPRYKQKIRCFSYKMKFDEAFEDSEIDLDIVKRACTDLLESDKFARLLEIVLALGNFMNEGPEAPSNRLAQGFALDSLTKLRSVKSFQAQTTALHYLVMLIQSRQRDILTFIKSDTDNIRAGANVSLTNALSNMTILKTGIRSIEQEHKIVAEIVADPEKREKITEEEQSFILGINKFYTKASKSLKDLSDIGEKTEKLFNDTLEYYCEDKTTTSEVFFRILQSFFADFELALNQNDAARQKFLKRQRARMERKEKDKASKSSKGAGRKQQK